MNIKPFELERYFAKYEFVSKYLLSPSDNNSLSQKELLKMADKTTKKMWENLTLGYTESSGHPLLRQEIAKLYIGIKADQVFVAAPQEGIFLALNSILQKGDHVICMFPGYQSLYEVPNSIGCSVSRWTPREKENWKFDPDDLPKLLKKNTKALVFNFPHNPTGYLPSLEDFKKIINFAKKHNLYVFSDEMYRFLEYNKKDRLPAACELCDKAISLFGMSKTFGLAGLRIGWLVTKDKEVIKSFAKIKDYTTICPSAPAEILSIIALKNKDKIISAHLKRIEKNLNILESFVNRNSKLISFSKPHAGTVCFPKLNINVDSYQFCEDVVKKTGIMVVPSTAFGYGNSHIRIGFGRDYFPKALSIFEKYLKSKYA